MSRLYAKSYRFSSAILCFFLLFSLQFASLSAKVTDFTDKERSIYELLSDFDFPEGILPKGVIGYEIDSTTGKFSAFLNGSCSFSVEGSSYRLNYNPTVSGFISKGKISRLEGVSVKLFFIWVNIVEVSRSGDDLAFSVGIAGAGFPVDNFEESPQCGCGFNCGDDDDGNRIVRKLRVNPFVSSA